jgi:flagellar hook assembly protein FlgD
MKKNLLFLYIILTLLFQSGLWAQNSLKSESKLYDSKIESTGSDIMPSGYQISNFPNPFNSTTAIQFKLRTDGPVTVEVFNIVGNKIKTLLQDQFYQKGSYSVWWDSKNDKGNLCPSGIYIIKLKTLEKTLSGKAMLIK